MERLVSDGLVSSIGVANFSRRRLALLIERATQAQSSIDSGDRPPIDRAADLFVNRATPDTENTVPQRANPTQTPANEAAVRVAAAAVARTAAETETEAAEREAAATAAAETEAVPRVAPKEAAGEEAVARSPPAPPVLFPAVVQIESHPGFRNEAMLAFCATHGVHVTAFSPLGGDDTVTAGLARPLKEFTRGAQADETLTVGLTRATHGVHVTAFSPLGGDETVTAAGLTRTSLLKSAAAAAAAVRLGCTPAQVKLVFS